MILAEKGRDLVDFKLIQEPGVMALVKVFLLEAMEDAL